MDYASLAVGLKGVLASGFLVSGAHVWRRSAAQQRRTMRRVLATTQQSLAASPQILARANGPFPRRAPVRKLRDMLDSPPKGPIVVTGAEGTGTSSVAASALSTSGTDGALLLRLNLRENPPGGGRRPFLRALMASSGYFTRQREAVDLHLLKEDSDATLQHDVTTFLNRLTEVFQEEKKAREKQTWGELWTGLPSKERPLPVVFVDELHVVQRSPSADIGSDFSTFLRWAMFVTGGQLAHVLFVARPEHIIKIEDANSEFHAQRQRLVVSYAPMEQVRRYLVSEAKGDLSDELIDRIAYNIGGQLKNLRLFAHTIENHRRQAEGGNFDRRISPHEACEMLLDDLTADSKELVLRTWDGLVMDGGDGAIDRLTSLKRAMRFWKMAKLIADEGALPRQTVVNRLFRPGKGCSASEIEDYVAKKLLTYCASPNSDLEEDASENSSFDDSIVETQQSKPRSRLGSGELWLTSASPLIRGAFAHLTSPEMAPSHLNAVEKEMEKMELAIREDQLERRLAEQSSRIGASAELLKVARKLGAKEKEDLGEIVSKSSRESLDAISELQVVRREYDALKWKNKWQQ